MTKPSTWRAFLRPAGHRLPETSCTGRAPHGLSQPPDMPNRDRSTPYRPPVRHQPSLPRQPPAGVSRPTFQTGQPLPATPGLPRGSNRLAAPRVPPASLPGIPKHAFTSRHPHKTDLCRRASRPAACLQPLSRSSPDGSASSSQEGPVPYFQRYSSGPGASASEKKKKLRHLLSPAFSLPPFPGPMTRHVLSSQPPANDGDRRPDLRNVFSGMGRAREGKGRFL